MEIKNWFLEKNFSQDERYVIATGELEIVKETEKAYNFKCESKFGNLTFWCPKSCVVKESEKKFVSKEELEELKKSSNKVIKCNGHKFIMVPKK